MKTTFREETILNKRINLMLKNLEMSKNTKERIKIKLVWEKFQKRFKLKEGKIIIINNKILAHGRTSFKINKSKLRKIL